MLGIQVIESSADKYVTRTKVIPEMLQHHGILHGGISAYLAENAASRAVNEHVDDTKEHAVGLEITSTHLEPVYEGDTIETVATPIRNTGRVRVWLVEQFRLSDGKMFNTSQMTIYMRHVR